MRAVHRALKRSIRVACVRRRTRCSRRRWRRRHVRCRRGALLYYRV